MKTAAITSQDLQSSVIVVPPLARNADLSFNRPANAQLLDHLRAGNVRTFMYGGNANLYNLGVKELATLAQMLSGLSKPGDWFIPSVGADFGKACEQIDMLREHAFPSAMVLPLRFPATSAGVARGLGLLAERYGKPLIAYLKDEGYMEPRDLAALVKDGAVCAVKYAIVRDDPAADAVLRDLLDRIPSDIVISGIGERPVIDHFVTFGLRAFTSGSASVAPGLSDQIRQLLLAGRHAQAAKVRELFMPLEDLRDAHSPLRVLHAAVALAGIAPTGPVGPFLSEIDDPSVLAQIEAAAKSLLAQPLAQAA